MTKGLVALVLGAATYMFTGQPVAGLLVAAAVFWLGPQTLGRRTSTRVHYTSPRAQPENAPGTQVVCKRVTPLRQEWASLKTGRLYDVLSQNGPPGAVPGDRGQVVMSGSGYRIRPSPEPE